MSAGTKFNAKNSNKLKDPSLQYDPLMSDEDRLLNLLISLVNMGISPRRLKKLMRAIRENEEQDVSLTGSIMSEDELSEKECNILLAKYMHEILKRCINLSLV